VFPFRYPPSPNLICRAIESIQMIGPPVVLPVGIPWVTRKYSIVTARFGVATFDESGQSDISGQPYTTTTFDVGTEVLTTPQSVYKFAGSPKVPTDVPSTIQIPLIYINMKRHMLPDVPVDVMASLVGRVNASTFVLGRFSFAAQTVLFTGGSSTI